MRFINLNRIIRGIWVFSSDKETTRDLLLSTFLFCLYNHCFGLILPFLPITFSPLPVAAHLQLWELCLFLDFSSVFYNTVHSKSHTAPFLMGRIGFLLHWSCLNCTLRTAASGGLHFLLKCIHYLKESQRYFWPACSTVLIFVEVQVDFLNLLILSCCTLTL